MRRCLLLLAAVLISGPAAADGNADDLYRAHARFLAATGEEAAALAALRARGVHGGPLLATIYAERDLIAAARRELAGHQRDPAASDAWLALARAHYRAGEPRRTERVLLQMTRNLDAAAAHERASLLARALLRQKRFDEAALALAGQRRRGELTPIDRYNLGVAWLGAGATERGAAELDALGRYRGEDPARRLLADRANLRLGYWFLRDWRGGLARSVLERIRLDGPFSGEATLALGWAELAHPGDSQTLTTEQAERCRESEPDLWEGTSEIHEVPRVDCRDIDEETDALGGAAARESNRAAYRRAAVAWRETVAAPATRTVVQEALVALPYALARSGEREAARDAYRTAVERLRTAREAIANGEATADASTLYTTEADRLDALADSLRAADTRLARIERWLAAAGKGGADPDTVAELGAVLDRLRATAPGDRGMATPNGAQRARLQALLRSLEASRATPGDRNARAEALRRGVPDVRERLDEALAATVAARASLDSDRRRQRLKRLDQYLEAAQLGLVSLME